MLNPFDITRDGLQHWMLGLLSWVQFTLLRLTKSRKLYYNQKGLPTFETSYNHHIGHIPSNS